MHFSIPETETRAGDGGSGGGGGGSGGSSSAAYVAYSIHVNGVLHCQVRYSQLLGLHEQLRKEFGASAVPPFPPKKIFALTAAEVEQRREQLEKYMQAVRQDPLLGSSEIFNSFLRKAQQETQQIPTEEVWLEVILSNGQKVKVNILTSDQTEDVLEAVATKLDLPEDLIGYFHLFLVREATDGAFSFIRKLQEFELPYVSVTSLRNPEYKILLRKSYWDSAYDDDVMEQRVGLNLLYAQTVADIERGWILANKEQHRQLRSLQEKVSKKEFIRLAQTLKYYGYLKFDPCITDFPEKGCHVIVGAGNSELNFQVKLPNDQIKEGSFKVTRMRCWRVTSSVPVHNGTSAQAPPAGGKPEVKLELAFEYLMSKDRLQWVTITSPQAIMLSICLQSMVDELMVKKSGGSIRKVRPAMTSLKGCRKSASAEPFPSFLCRCSAGGPMVPHSSAPTASKQQSLLLSWILQMPAGKPWRRSRANWALSACEPSPIPALLPTLGPTISMATTPLKASVTRTCEGPALALLLCGMYNLLLG